LKAQHVFLEQKHGGWMDNDGAYGEFEFDVAARAGIPEARAVAFIR
jgi:hypothetical protein